MQPSGQRWAQVLQPVQRSSNQRRLVRARGEIGRVTSGNSMVAGGLIIRWMVTAMPLRMPMPYICLCLASLPALLHADCNGFHFLVEGRPFDWRLYFHDQGTWAALAVFSRVGRVWDSPRLAR